MENQNSNHPNFEPADIVEKPSQASEEISFQEVSGSNEFDLNNETSNSKYKNESNSSSSENLESQDGSQDLNKGTSAELEGYNVPEHFKKKAIEACSAIAKHKIAAGIVAVLLAVLILFATHIICIHDWKPANCYYPETCSICNQTRGVAYGHEWEDATCTQGKKCATCGLELSDTKLEHQVAEWTPFLEPTCKLFGKNVATCTVCGNQVTEILDKKEHSWSDWVITKEPSKSAKGEKSIKCSVCGEILKTEVFDLSPEEKEANYKGSCETYDFKDLARNADSYKGNHFKTRGKVVQVIGDGDLYNLRVEVTQKSYGLWDDVIYVIYRRPAGAPKIIEDDIVMLYGEIKGTTSYKTVLGATITLPEIVAEYIDIE